MDIQANINRFERELAEADRRGMCDLVNYIRKSDFYTAPASTKYHLSCKGGLLQHSLNVLDALRGLLIQSPDQKNWIYPVAGKEIFEYPNKSITIIALLHDICKTNFYAEDVRNVKNKQTGQWMQVPYYTVDDKLPLGHGPKSVLILKNFISLTEEETFAIWHHMGFAELNHMDTVTFSNAVEKHPLILALNTADMQATHIMEEETDNNFLF